MPTLFSELVSSFENPAWEKHTKNSLFQIHVVFVIRRELKGCLQCWLPNISIVSDLYIYMYIHVISDINQRK